MARLAPHQTGYRGDPYDEKADLAQERECEAGRCRHPEHQTLRRFHPADSSEEAAS